MQSDVNERKIWSQKDDLILMNNKLILHQIKMKKMWKCDVRDVKMERKSVKTLFQLIQTLIDAYAFKKDSMALKSISKGSYLKMNNETFKI